MNISKISTKLLGIVLTMLVVVVFSPISPAFAEKPVQLTKADCDEIVAAAEAKANNELSAVRVPAGNATTKMHIACVDKDGKIIVFKSMEDAWPGSIDIARAKANTARAFSSNENALSSRSIGCLSQPGGPLWMIGNSNQAPAVKGNAKTNGKVGGLIQFPGGLPLYKDSDGDGTNDTLVGAIGVSGDGVEQDEDVAQAGAEADQPGPAPDYQAPLNLRSAAPFFIDTDIDNPGPGGDDGDPCTIGS